MPKGVKGSGRPTARVQRYRPGSVPPPGVEFRPSAAQKEALAAVVMDPALAGNRRALARKIGMNDKSVYPWFHNPAFRTWWNTALLELTREQVGPMVQELQRLVYDDSTDEQGRPVVSASAKAKVVDTILKALPQTQSGDVGTAVAAILERWNPHYGRARIVATPKGIAAEIEPVAQRGENATAPPAPPEAMALPPGEGPVRSLREIADAALAEAKRTHVRVVEQPAADPTSVERRYSAAPRRPPALAPAEGDGGRKSRSLDRTVDGPRPSSAPETSEPPESSAVAPPTATAASPAPEPVIPRLYPHLFSGGRCKRCGVAEGHTSRWCKGPTPAGDNARGPDAVKRTLPEGTRGIDRIMRRMRERDHEGE